MTRYRRLDDGLGLLHAVMLAVPLGVLMWTAIIAALAVIL